MYTDYERPLGLEHHLMLCLPEAPLQTAGPKQHVRLYLSRGPGPDFSERDRAVLTLLRPHLHQAFLEGERRRHPVPRLTPRQKELLRLLAAGHTNTQIARRLGISEGTVRTHLENIYERLDVSWPSTSGITTAIGPLRWSVKCCVALRPLPDGVIDLDQFRVQRRDRAGGVIHEYRLVA